MSVVRTEKELGEALKRGDDKIEIEGNLVNKTVRIRATGKLAWFVAIGALGIAVVSFFGTGGVGGVVSAGVAPAAVGVLGGAATYSAIAIAVAAGGVGALNSLRNYKEVSRSKDKLVLKRK